MLLQNGHVVAYESRQLIPAEINYPAGERELLAVKFGLERIQALCVGYPVQVIY